MAYTVYCKCILYSVYGILNSTTTHNTVHPVHTLHTVHTLYIPKLAAPRVLFHIV